MRLSRLMCIMKSLFPIFCFLVGLLPCVGNAVEVQGKFAPSAGKVVVFAGQDNASVGGTDDYRDG